MKLHYYHIVIGWMVPWCKYLFIFLFILLYVHCLGAEVIELSGEFESEIFINDQYEEPQAGTINSLTLQADAQVNEHTSFHSRLIFSHFSGYKIGEEDSDLVIDRAHLNLYLPKFDLRIGKQRLAWGSGFAFNPTDLFNPPDYTDPRGEPTGVSAIRLTVPMGTVSEIMLVGAQQTTMKYLDQASDSSLTTAKAAQDTEIALRGKTNLGGFDFSLIAIDLGEDEAEKLGGSLSGELFKLGVWCEGAYTFPEQILVDRFEDDEYWQLVVGADFTFAKGFYLLGEYYRNGQGKWSLDDYQWSRQQLGQLANLGQDYFFGSCRYIHKELITTSLSGLLNVNDQSFFFHPQIAYDVYSDTMIASGMHGFCGQEKSEFYGMKNSRNYRMFNEYYLKFQVNF